MGSFLLSIDVGSNSLRSALVTSTGEIVAIHKAPIVTWWHVGVMEQSSDNIWQTLVHSVNQLLRNNSVSPDSIAGIGIDSTASLVLLNKNMNPQPLPGNPSANILGWMDHRAAMQADVLTQQHPQLLKGMGARLLPESSVPRLFWLKQEAPDTWQNTHCILDLYDFLTWKCTGTLCRTITSISNLNKDNALQHIGLDIGPRLDGELFQPGSSIDSGLSQKAAEQLGLLAGTPVASGIVDGLGGMLATILAEHNDHNENKLHLDTLTQRMTMIVGTSSVYIAHTVLTIESPYFWGPWPSMFGRYNKYIIRQTAAGALVDHILKSHPAFLAMQNQAISRGISIYQLLNRRLKDMAGEQPVAELTKNLHILPYFAGNHCPRMDFTLRGMASGLSLDRSEESLALIYLATIQALALGARHNIQLLKQLGHNINTLMPAGGLAKNPLFMSTHINAMDIPAAMPEEPDAMQLGAAITASVAAGIYENLEQAMKAMSRYREILKPEAEETNYLKKKYDVFLEMYEDQMKYKK